VAPDGTVSTPPTPPAGLAVEGYALPDGRALLYGTVPPQTQTVVLVIGGRRVEVQPAHGAFAAALGSDEMVGEIELSLPSGPRRCPFDEEARDYRCGDSSEQGSSSSSSSSSGSAGTVYATTSTTSR
jgi:hypothetical protein